jgi:hypothetical protein
MRTHKVRHRKSVLLGVAATVACLCAGCSGALEAGHGTRFTGANPGVYPPSAVVQGKTYAEWSAVWWQWVSSIPIEDNPMPDPTGAKAGVGQVWPVWFLLGTTGGAVERTCTVPVGKPIFFPILTNSSAIPEDGTTEAQLRAVCKDSLDHATEMDASVDGVALQGLGHYRVASPLFQCTEPGAPHGIWTGYEGTYESVAEGYYIILEPLAPGAHTVHFHGKMVWPAVYPNASVFEVEATYHLTVG